MSIVDPFTLKLYSVTEPRGRELLKAYIATYMDGGSKRSSKSKKIETLPDCDTRNLGDPVHGDPTDIIRFFLSDVYHDAGDLMNVSKN